MPSKRHRNRESSVTGNATPTEDIRAHMNSETQKKMSLRSDEEENQAALVSENAREESESEDLDNEGDTEISITELARMMKDKFREFSDNFKSQGEKTSSLTEALNSGLSKLEESMSRYETNNIKIEEKIDVFTNTVEEIHRKHDTLDSTVKELGIKVAQIDEIQKELLEKQHQVIRLSDELKEKMAIIESSNRRLEFLEEWREAVKAKDESDEQRGRKMNVWIYGVEETEKENLFDVITNFCTSVLKLKSDVPDNWLIKNAHRVGDYTKPRRPIIIAFVLWEDRQSLLKAASNLYQFNKDNNTKFSVKTDLAPKARLERSNLYGVAQIMREKENLYVRVCDNAKGKVWLERKTPNAIKWIKVQNIDPTYRELAKNRRKNKDKQ